MTERAERNDVNSEVEAPDSALPEVKRAVVYTPQEGDVVVIEVGRWATMEHADRLQEQARAAFGMDVKIVVLSEAHFAGVVRNG